MMKLADLIEENCELISEVESLDNGKNLNQARFDVMSAAGCIRYYAGWADKVSTNHQHQYISMVILTTTLDPRQGHRHPARLFQLHQG